MNVKLVLQRLWVGSDTARCTERSSSVMIGRWLVCGDHRLGLTLQVMMEFSGLLECHTLSGLVQLPKTVS